MPDPLLTQAVDAVKARLSELTIGSGGYLAAIESAPADLDARSWTSEAMQDALRAVASRYPAVLISLDELTGFEGTAGGRKIEWRARASLNLYLVGDHRRDTVEGRLDPDDVADGDPTADPGLRRLWEDCFTRLAGWSPISATTRLEPVNSRTTLVSPELTVVEIRFDTQLTITSTPLAALPTMPEAVVTVQDADSESIILKENLP